MPTATAEMTRIIEIEIIAPNRPPELAPGEQVIGYAVIGRGDDNAFDQDQLDAAVSQWAPVARTHTLWCYIGWGFDEDVADFRQQRKCVWNDRLGEWLRRK